MYFEIGIENGKTQQNIGTLWRSASQLGASGIFTIGKRYRKEVTDTSKAHLNIPLRNYENLSELLVSRPHGCRIVGVEMGGVPLSQFEHPDQCIYILGSEDSGLSRQAIESCNHLVSLESVNAPSYNVAVAGSLIMYHRMFGLGCGIK